ncbi:hypothetical protein, partial [Vibrio fluvialis]|uniref:hypothetical protein n=1 Tax=Vibrio fluvialis TaxID=676 RepID=UPI001EEB068C
AYTTTKQTILQHLVQKQGSAPKVTTESQRRLAKNSYFVLLIFCLLKVRVIYFHNKTPDLSESIARKIPVLE